MAGRTEASEAETSASAYGAAVVSGGLSHARFRYLNTGERLQNAARNEAGELPRTFTRKVGAGYVFQAFLNSAPLVLIDLLVLTATISACRFLFRELDLKVGIDVSSYLIPIATGFLLLNFELGLYPGVRLSPVEELRRLVVSVTCMFTVWAISVMVLRGALTVQWVFLLVVYLTSLLALPICRSWFRQLLGKWTRWGIPVLVCGNDPATVRLYQWLSDNHHLGMRPVGIIADPEALNVGADDHWYAGSWDQVHDIACRRGVYWAVVLPPENKHDAISALIADYLYTIPHVHVLSEITGLPDHWNPQQLDGLTGIHLQQNLMLPLPRLTKRFMDLAASLLGGLVLLPLFFYLAVAVKMSSRGPIVYSHERIGRNGRRFKAWKFRSMFQNADQLLELYLDEHPELQEEWECDHKLKFDPRVTRIGRFLRKTSLDELPQLWNVIRGDMSLVGPRPIVDAEIDKYGPYYGLYTMVKPGITGLWQVSGRNNTTYDERVQFDAYYVRNWSPWLDLYLLLRTIRIVLFAKGAY
ncbi:MAG: undecaprenyl-phosphate galactose phosphotransferase WbaP [Planctomycetes bacterium]|nr:undecaprenyl-phosphate galactose phosphotransferase WbaP [Planctomycetota bacterium]